jgi:hypothetical protein
LLKFAPFVASRQYVSPLTRYVVANVYGVPVKLILKLVWLLPDRAKDALALRLSLGEN